MSIKVLKGKVYLGTATPETGGGGGQTINNEDITVTQNGEYSASEGYTGLGTVTVNVPQGDIVTATNNTGAAIASGDKVWLEKVSGGWNAINFYGGANFNIIGSPTVSADRVASGFSNSNYLQLKNTFRPTTGTWEVVVKFKPYSAKIASLMSKITSSQQYYGFRLDTIDSGKMYYLISNNTGATYLFEGEGSNSYVLNAWNWVKFEFTGSAYNAYLSSDGKTWTSDKTYTSSSRLYDFTSATNIGNIPETSDRYFDGEIDLTETYIKINGVKTTMYDLTVSQSSFSGFANEAIANGASGEVKTVLPEQVTVTVTVDADSADISAE